MGHHPSAPEDRTKSLMENSTVRVPGVSGYRGKGQHTGTLNHILSISKIKMFQYVSTCFDRMTTLLFSIKTI